MRSSGLFWILGGTIATLLLTGGAFYVWHEAAVSDVEIAAAWIRWLSGDDPTAAYMSLHNRADRYLVLIGAESKAYSEVSLHHTLSSPQLTQMITSDSIKIPPHKILQFEEGGYHLMLMRPKRPIQPGDEVLITLRFSSDLFGPVIFTVCGATGEKGALEQSSILSGPASS